ncbi:MAG: 3-deoxy-manno-octulosonate cytidylyltransferase [Magnetococcales bacterium]|nr:3-deoxy-manno-octulosonate cytidylyltransferase [Magnetococcales bacterium]
MARRFAVVIPARYASTRLPGKPLLNLAGKPMIRWVYEAASRSGASTVLVATDDLRIRDAVTGFGGEAVMTSPDHLSGTDRVAQAALELDEEVIVNVQGDEPLLEPALIRQVAAPLLEDPALTMSTLAQPLLDPAEWHNPNVVKIVCDRRGRALYFSRAPIPWDRDRSSLEAPLHPLALHHIGLYGFRADFLQTFSALQPTPLESLERLEQLRALEHGFDIRVIVTQRMVARGVDVPEDLERVRLELLAGNREGGA